MKASVRDVAREAAAVPPVAWRRFFEWKRWQAHSKRFKVSVCVWEPNFSAAGWDPLEAAERRAVGMGVCVQGRNWGARCVCVRVAQLQPFRFVIGGVL